jgi:hypothetical protein
MNAPASATTDKLSVFQLVILILSIVILGVLIVDTLTTLPTEASRLFQGLDFAICIIFLVDFCIRFRQPQAVALPSSGMPAHIRPILSVVPAHIYASTRI